MKKAIWLCVACVVLAGCGGGGSSGGGAGDDPESNTFTSGGTALSATSTEAGGTKTTTITDASGATLLTMATTVNGVTLTGADGSTRTTTFNTALSGMPTNFATNALGTYIAGQVAGYSAMCLSKDSPGCDWFPDTQCTLGCCADHDACYQLNGCSATSWLLIGASTACINCNGLAEYCILTACVGVTDSRTTDRCYDARCGQYYDCSEADCYSCTSPCDSTSPARCTSTVYESCCGNGSCEVLETTANCAIDCAEGEGYNTCCYESSDCPSETPTDCPGGCCCCGYGEVCTTDGSHVCTGSAAMTLKGGVDPDVAEILKRCEGKPKSECR